MSAAGKGQYFFNFHLFHQKKRLRICGSKRFQPAKAFCVFQRDIIRVEKPVNPADLLWNIMQAFRICVYRLGKRGDITFADRQTARLGVPTVPFQKIAASLKGPENRKALNAADGTNSHISVNAQKKNRFSKALQKPCAHNSNNAGIPALPCKN